MQKYHIKYAAELHKLLIPSHNIEILPIQYLKMSPIPLPSFAYPDMVKIQTNHAPTNTLFLLTNWAKMNQIYKGSSCKASDHAKWLTTSRWEITESHQIQKNQDSRYFLIWEIYLLEKKWFVAISSHLEIRFVQKSKQFCDILDFAFQKRTCFLYKTKGYLVYHKTKMGQRKSFLM